MRSTTASMTRLVAVSAFAALVSSGVALGQTPDRPGDGRNGDAQRPTQAAATAAPLDDRTFVTEMSIAGMAEVQLGELAQQRGEHADVKSFGQMMVKDHTQANNELTAIAKSAGLTPARELDQKHRDLMTKLADQEVTVAWTVWVQKQVLQSDFGARDDDYRWVTERIMEVAARHAQGRVVSTLEGGYNVTALGRCVVEHVSALAGAQALSPEAGSRAAR